MANCDVKDHGCGDDTAAGKLKSLVGQQVETSMESVLAKVQQRLVQEELDRRVDLVLKGLAKRDDLHKQLSGLTPDQKGLDDNGAVVCETYSQGRFEQRKGVAEQLSGLNAALDDALANGKYCKLKHALGCCGK